MVTESQNSKSSRTANRRPHPAQPNLHPSAGAARRYAPRRISMLNTKDNYLNAFCRDTVFLKNPIAELWPWFTDFFFFSLVIHGPVRFKSTAIICIWCGLIYGFLYPAGIWEGYTVKCDLQLTLLYAHTYLNKRRRGCMGWESMKGTVREGGRRGEVEGGKLQNNILHKLLKQMGHRYRENGKEGEGTGGRNKKKRLVMSVLSVTSFVDSHRVSMTTVKIPLGERYKTLKLHFANLFIDLIWCGRCRTDALHNSRWHCDLCQREIYMQQIPIGLFVLQWNTMILSRYIHVQGTAPQEVEVIRWVVRLNQSDQSSISCGVWPNLAKTGDRWLSGYLEWKLHSDSLRLPGKHIITSTNIFIASQCSTVALC